MIAFPNCKINIGLNIVAKRSDGFHDIETIFYPLSLCDALEVLPSTKQDGEDEFILEGMLLDGDPHQNLCMKALRLMRSVVNIDPVKMVLLKKIPSGAGLGGGSADAAFALKMLNAYCNAGLSDDQLKGLAAQLGSDCSFFITDIPAYAHGKGDLLEKAIVNLQGYTLVLVKPPVFVSTADAYSGVTPALSTLSLKTLIQQPISTWQHTIKNDFEKNIFLHYPIIATIKEKMYNMGALYASMSGSGSSVFGIFDHPVNGAHLFLDCFYHEELFK
ncbi:MAG: 4-(cytidine 5'-diphospho)-2-C-methyl-D-erythritol kinase [Bacteroidetes bacterium]|nr:4-(cytidine 5'-diphospho)-2-C-methyl-D-erythritol kinase [Bacteroidota bacterium]